MLTEVGIVLVVSLAVLSTHRCKLAVRSLAAT